jgi:hypothetical protein
MRKAIILAATNMLWSIDRPSFFVLIIDKEMLVELACYTVRILLFSVFVTITFRNVSEMHLAAIRFIYPMLFLMLTLRLC